MIDNEVLTHVYDVTPEALWNAVKVVLKMTEGVTLEATDDEQMQAISRRACRGQAGAKTWSQSWSHA